MALPDEVDTFAKLALHFARDIDAVLLARSRGKTFEERLQWLEEMQALARSAKERPEVRR